MTTKSLDGYPLHEDVSLGEGPGRRGDGALRRFRDLVYYLGFSKGEMY